MPASKLRGNLEAPSVSNLSLVKGKEVWRIVGAEYGENLWRSLENNREGLFLFTRLTNLLKRMVFGEERHEELYKILEDAFLALQTKKSKEDLLALELVLVSRLLHQLGYFKLKEEYVSFLEEDINKIKSEDVLAKQRLLITEINRALKESHL